MSKNLKEFYFLFVLIFSGLATDFSENQIGLITLFLITVFMLFVYKVKITKQYIYAIVVWLIYAFVSIIIHREIFEFFIFRHLAYITIAYCMVMLYKVDFFFKYEKNIYYLAYISIFFWFWEWINPSSLRALSSLIDISGNTIGWQHKNNFIVYNLELRYILTSSTFFPRNCGFAWEPGPYAIFLSIGIVINLLKNKLRISGNTKLYVLLFALLTTQSTTGYSVVAIIFIYLFSRDLKGLKRYLITVVAIIISFSIFISFDFMQDKIHKQIEDVQIMEQTLNRALSQNTSFSTGRFGGLYIAWQDFKRNPLFGVAGSSESRYATIDGIGLSIRNGIGNIISSYGMFGFIFFILFLIKTSNLLSIITKSNASYALFITIFLCLMGFSLFTTPIISSFIFFSIFYNKKSMSIIKNENQYHNDNVTQEII